MGESRDLIRVESSADGQMGTNSYLVQDEASGDCILIDAHMEPELILAALERRSLRPLVIALTHTDFDHVAGLPALRSALGEIPIAVHPAERFTLEQGVGLRTEFSYPQPRFGQLWDLIPGQELAVGSLRVQVLHTPGHSPGGVTLRIGRRLFTGDALFAGSIGRTDLSRSEPDALLRGIRSELMSLPDDYLVFPGHGSMTTLGQERRYNPFL
ncbi:MAG TPA: MBL fold metallo-hydrolase [Candidatus Nitrosotalea sp.]|nr:MBL fold metallo-hydrolase [Candidatus Nitrosotalea sp.]